MHCYKVTRGRGTSAMSSSTLPRSEIQAHKSLCTPTMLPAYPPLLRSLHSVSWLPAVLGNKLLTRHLLFQSPPEASPCPTPKFLFSPVSTPRCPFPLTPPLSRLQHPCSRQFHHATGSAAVPTAAVYVRAGKAGLGTVGGEDRLRSMLVRTCACACACACVYTELYT